MSVRKKILVVLLTAVLLFFVFYLVHTCGQTSDRGVAFEDLIGGTFACEDESLTVLDENRVVYRRGETDESLSVLKYEEGILLIGTDGLTRRFMVVGKDRIYRANRYLKRRESA